MAVAKTTGSMFNDIRIALRLLFQSPSFTAIAVLTLALGIGANTAIFSVMNTLMFRPLPYDDPEELVRLFRTSTQSRSWPHSVANYFDYAAQTTTLEHVTGLKFTRFSLAVPGEPAETLRGLAVTSEFFPMLRVTPALGRVFSAEEDEPGRSQVVVLSHRFWMNRFGGDPNIVGRALRMDGENVTVVGVLTASAEYMQLWGPIDAWRPLAFTPSERANRRDHWLYVLARLKAGSTRATAQAELNAIAARLAEAHPEHNAHHGLRLAPLHESIGDEASRRFAWLMLGLTGFVLLIACVNLANLQMARAAIRAREFAVRLAMGAGRWRLIRQLLVESSLIALLGGGAGLLLACWLKDEIGSRIRRWSPSGIPVEIDAQVLWFTFACAAATALVFGMVPAWFASRTNVNDVLKANTRSATAARSQNKLRHALIVGEVALALVLLTGAGLVIRGLHQYIRHDPGWRVDGLLTGWIPLRSAKYDAPEQRRVFVERLEERLAALPGVESVGISSYVPIWAFGTTRGFLIEGQSSPPLGQEPIGNFEAVTLDYFRTMGMRLLEGRLFNATDAAKRPDVVIINEAMARRFWPNESPNGKRIGSGDRNHPLWQEIIGVVNDVRFPGNLARPETSWQMYRPFAQEPRSSFAIELRTAGPPSGWITAVRRSVADLDPDLPVNELEPARQTIDRLLEHFALASFFLGAFALLGLVLAALGIYGVISYFVVQRTGEIGIRMALGAQIRDVLWLVLGKGMFLCCAGVLIGTVGAWAMARLLSAAVPELQSRDPMTFLAVVGGLIVVALFACWLPARRAARVDPMMALRYE
ncbi:MAG: ABC transporter permease [Verrucomicrobiota bacterium]|jgi:putative ABC transport system permease protein